MITIANPGIALSCHEDGAGLMLDDRQRGLGWRPERASLVYQVRRDPEGVGSLAGNSRVRLG